MDYRSRELRELADRAAEARLEDARRRTAQEDLRRLHQRMEEFVRAWNDFALEYVERGTFNVKKARSVRRAWERLEREGVWPR